MLGRNAKSVNQPASMPPGNTGVSWPSIAQFAYVAATKIAAATTEARRNFQPTECAPSPGWHKIQKPIVANTWIENATKAWIRQSAIRRSVRVWATNQSPNTARTRGPNRAAHATARYFRICSRCAPMRCPPQDHPPRRTRAIQLTAATSHRRTLSIETPPAQGAHIDSRPSTKGHPGSAISVCNLAGYVPFAGMQSAHRSTPESPTCKSSEWRVGKRW